jgi:predicted dehydrogenase
MAEIVSKNELKCLIIGCGSIGIRHLKNLLTLNVGRVIAFDTSETLRQTIRSQFPVEVPNTLDHAWACHPDVVFITVPTYLHIPLCLEAAQRGCHVFIEKPLAHTLEGADSLLDMVREKELVAMVGCNMRFHPGPKKIEKMLMNGDIGQVLAARFQTGSYLPEWRAGQDYKNSYSASESKGGGAILDCSHEIDLALWLLGPGELVGSASIPAQCLGLEVEGLAEIIIQHQSGVLSNVHLNFVQRDYRRICQIIGSEGTIYWDFVSGEVQRFTEKGLCFTRKQPEDWEINQMYLDEIKYFIQCIKNNTPTFNGIEEGLRVLNLALRAKVRGLVYGKGGSA